MTRFPVMIGHNPIRKVHNKYENRIGRYCDALTRQSAATDRPNGTPGPYCRRSGEYHFNEYMVCFHHLEKIKENGSIEAGPGDDDEAIRLINLWEKKGMVSMTTTSDDQAARETEIRQRIIREITEDLADRTFTSANDTYSVGWRRGMQRAISIIERGGAQPEDQTRHIAKDRP